MSDSLLLGIIFVLSVGYLAYKLYPKNNESCGCGNCGCKTKEDKKPK
ncbi:FeoB-associated Cys-rich membrane protein [Helicobacter winghamensis]